jgi:AcrR family transcriptional regulator
MPRTEAENQRLREEQRAKILAAARKVFARKGIAATMADVAAAAEVSQGLAYRYFANKDALFRALVEQTILSALSGIQHVLELPTSPGERLDLLVTRVLQARREHPEFFQLFQQVLSDEATPADLRQLVSKRSQSYQDAIRQLIVEGQAIGEVAAGDPDQLITAIMACFEGLSRLALRDPQQVKNHFPDAAIILRMLKP